MIRRNFSKTSDFATVTFLFLLFVTLSFVQITATAQVTSSPYSRYGIGDIGGKGFGQGFTLGGTHIALQNDTTPIFFINSGNPASYSNMRLVTAELGATYNRVQLESASAKKTINNASLSYISLAFPFKKWWGGSVGLVPFSSVGYKVSDEQEIEGVGTVKYLYQGTGGINQVYFGNGITPFIGIPRHYQMSSKYARLHSLKHPDQTVKSCHEVYEDRQKIRKVLNRKKFLQSLAIGANASYLFGNMENTRRSIFPSSLYAFNARTGTSTRIDGMYFDYGMQMAYTVDSIRFKDKADTCRPVKFRDLKENVKILFGVTFAAQSNVNATIDSLSYSYFNNSLGYEIVKDTIENTTGTKGKITLPLSMGFGIGFKKGDKWLVAADFAVQNWSNYKVFGQTQGLKNTMRVSLGAQYVPNARPNAS
ncbi:MAG: hypothetical protein NTX97_01265, partial [Bacteroidetes bacterium]|nr:hypothetical protein [Bacteroidota bacterium]